MRIWSVHSSYLDAKGLVALWRETLLAKAVLEGKTTGYKNHSQLIRFKALKNPLAAINCYLADIYKEAIFRGYKFNSTKFDSTKFDANLKCNLMPVTQGQLEYEFIHLQNKLKLRDAVKFEANNNLTSLKAHPIFTIVSGSIEHWEKI